MMVLELFGEVVKLEVNLRKFVVSKILIFDDG